MNRLKLIVHLNQRGYKNISRNQSLKIEKGQKAVSTEKELYSNFEEVDFENNEDDNDFDNLEANFSSVDKTYDEHKWEVRRNENLLKARIIARKYFKSTDPNFLTWSERRQINTLYNKDKEEWTPERLSASFPALPETIKKVLNTPYMPKTTKAVIKYDQNVINNWNKFKAGNLVLSSQLEAHLQKFKNRNTHAINLEAIAEQFVRSKPVFLSPKSTLFTNIVKNYIESKNTTEEKSLLQLSDGTVVNDTKNKDLMLYSVHNNTTIDRKYATMDTFVEKQVSKMTDHSNLSLENKLLIQEYKDKKNKDTVSNFEESKSTEQNKSVKLMKEVEIIEPSGVHNKTVEPSTMQDNTSKLPVMQVSLDKIETYKNSLETGIIKWEKKSSLSEQTDYPRYIKVPYQKAKKGVTFKVNDRYYDCDGEFLYRVPGLRSN